MGRPDRTRERQNGDKRCPGCHQWNPQKGTTNLTRCRVCSRSFCFECGLLLTGKVMDHFQGPKAVCPQHSNNAVGTIAAASTKAAPAAPRTESRKIAKKKLRVEAEYWDMAEEYDEVWQGSMRP